MKKKNIFLVMAILVFALTACSTKETNSTVTNEVVDIEDNVSANANALVGNTTIMQETTQEDTTELTTELPTENIETTEQSSSTKPTTEITTEEIIENEIQGSVTPIPTTQETTTEQIETTQEVPKEKVWVVDKEAWDEEVVVVDQEAWTEYGGRNVYQCTMCKYEWHDETINPDSWYYIWHEHNGLYPYDESKPCFGTNYLVWPEKYIIAEHPAVTHTEIVHHEEEGHWEYH